MQETQEYYRKMKIKEWGKLDKIRPFYSGEYTNYIIKIADSVRQETEI